MRIAKALAWLLLGLALLMFLGTGVFIFKESGDAGEAARYRAAGECATGSGGATCYTVTTAAVGSKSISGGVLGVSFLVVGFGDESETLTAAGSQSLFEALRVGSVVTVKVWQGQVTLVEDGTLRADTFDNPILQAGRDQPDALISGGLGLLLLFYSVLVFRRARAPLTPVPPDLELEWSSGPFGLDGRRALDVTRVYRLSHGIVAIVWSGATVVLVSIATALRIQLSLLSGIIGGAIGLALAAYVALALRRSSLEVGPRGITLTGFRASKTIQWTDVESVGVQRGRCVVRVRKSVTSGSPITLRTRDFSAYARVKENASMPGLIALYLKESGPAPPPVGVGPVPPPLSAPAAPAVLVRAGFAIRIAAWGIDIVALAVIGFVVAVIIDAVLAGVNGGNVPAADENPAALVGYGITLVAYLVVSWHAGATLGMLMLRLRVIDASSGRPPSWGRSLERFLAAIPSMVLIVPVGLFSALGERRLALHDRVARTLVVTRARQPASLASPGPWPAA